MGVVLNQVFAYESRMDVLYFCNRQPWTCSHGEVLECRYEDGRIFAKVKFERSKFSEDEDIVLVYNSEGIPFMGCPTKFCLLMS